MSEKIIFNLELDTDDAVESLNKIEDGVEGVGVASKKSEDGVKSMSGGFKLLGGAIKAAGIGLLVGALGFLADAFSKNQVIMDTVSVIMGTIQDVFTQVSDVLVDVYENVSSSTEKFDALGKVLTGIITIGLTPMKLSFYGIKLALQEAQLIWEKSMFGDGDPESIKKLNESIEETKENLIEVGVSAVDAAIDIKNNVVEAVGEMSDITSEIIDGISEIDIAQTKSSREYLENLKKRALINSATNSKLLEEYDRQAEIQRQIRDDETASFEERLIANEKLGELLKDQEKIMLSNAAIGVELANAELVKNNTIENQVALIEAQTEQAAISAQIEGKRSEQLVSQNSLIREQIENNKELNLIGLEESERKKQEVEDERVRLTELAEKTISDKQELIDKLKEIDALAKEELLELELEEEEARQETERAKQDFDISLMDEGLERQLSILERKYEQDIAAAEKLGKDTSKIEEKYANDRVRINRNAEKKKRSDNLATVNNALEGASQLLNGLSAFVEEGSKAAQNLAIAQVVIDTIKGGIAAVTTSISQFGPVAGGIIGGVLAAGIAVSGYSAIQKIKSTKPGGGNINTRIDTPTSTTNVGGEGIVTDTPPPDFLTQGASDTNQLTNAINGQSNTPIKTYVVSSDVTTAQQLERNRVNNAKI